MKPNGMRSSLGLLATLATMTLAVGACGNGSSGGTSTSTAPVNVGFLAAFSGTITYGVPLLEGAKVAALNIEKGGGIMGRTVNFIPEDDSFDPIDAVTVARKMLAVDNVDLVLGLAAADWRDALPVLEAAKMVSFTHITDPALDDQLYPYSYATTPSDGLEGVAMTAYAASKHYQRIAVVFDEASNAQTLVPGILAAANALNISVVSRPTLPVGVPSYVAAVQSIAASHPDAILTQVDPTTASVLFPELNAAGLASVPVIGSDSTLQAAWVKAVGAANMASGSIVSVQSIASAAGPGGQQFINGYQSLFHKPYDVRSISSYDGLNVAALAMVDAKSTNPTVYVKYIADVTDPGPGKTVVYDFATGSKLLSEGKKIKYSGVGSPMTYNQFHRVVGDFEVDKETPSGQPTRLALLPADMIGKVIGA